MAKGSDRNGSSDAETETQFVAVVIARSIEQAEEFRGLLEDHDIPVIVGTDDEQVVVAAPIEPETGAADPVHGIAVLVPEAMLDNAGAVIAQREDLGHLGDDEDLPDDEDDEEFAVGKDLPEGWGEHDLAGDEFLDDRNDLDVQIDEQDDSDENGHRSAP